MELDLQRFYNINRRVVMWILFFAGLFLLRDFFSLVFLTFIFGFLMRSVARMVQSTTRAPYWAAVLGPYLVAIALLVLLMVAAIPRLADEGARFSRRLPDLFYSLAVEVQKAAPRYGMEEALTKYVDADVRPATTDDQTPDSPLATSQPSPRPDATKILGNKLQRAVLGFLPSITGNQAPTSLPDMSRRFIGGIFGGTLTFLLAILLSFLIVLDYDKISHELEKMAGHTARAVLP